MQAVQFFALFPRQGWTRKSDFFKYLAGFAAQFSLSAKATIAAKCTALAAEARGEGGPVGRQTRDTSAARKAAKITAIETANTVNANDAE